MVDNAEADVASVILTSVKFDMFKWFNPTKVSFILFVSEINLSI
jgi:hypothetical protein